MNERLPAAPKTHFLARLSRVTTSGAFISEIDGLRFIAIGTVVLFHLAVALNIRNPAVYHMPGGNILAAVAVKGFHGVELFFIISGFILAMPFASTYLKGKPKVNLGAYYLRRVTRLEPPYILSMLMFFGVLVFLKHQDAGTLLPHLLASLGYIHNLTFAQESLINNVAWSLEIEIQFYVLAPVLSMIFAISSKRLRRTLLAVCILAAVTGHTFFFRHDPRWSMTIFNYIQFFLIGFLLCDVFLDDWKERPGKTPAWDIVSLIGWPALFYIWNAPDPSRYLFNAEYSGVVENYFFPVSAFFLYVAVFRGTISNRIMTNIWITTIGGMCYTIYLLHNYLIGGLTALTRNISIGDSYTLNIAMQSVLVVLPTLVVCAMYFALIERPCMKKDWPVRLYRTIMGTAR